MRRTASNSRAAATASRPDSRSTSSRWRRQESPRASMACASRCTKSPPAPRATRTTPTSTGTAAFFLHPAEAFHGVLGVIQGNDVVIALSYGGETDEILRLLETIRRLGASLIAITGVPESSLAQAADVALDCSVTEEACPMNLVPTASTTAALAIGDALAMTLLVEKGFKPEDFANLHPGGKDRKSVV